MARFFNQLFGYSVSNGGTEDPLMLGFNPGDNGLVAKSFPDLMLQTPTTLYVSQTIYTVKFKIPKLTTTVTNIVVALATGGATFTSSSIGFYNNAGTKLGETASLNTLLAGTGIITCPLASPVTGVTSGYYHAAIRVTATTMPKFQGLIPNVDTGNAGLGGADLRFATAGTGQTALPATITMSGRSNYSANYMWACLS